jgi:hypothetical protein
MLRAPCSLELLVYCYGCGAIHTLNIFQFDTTWSFVWNAACNLSINQSIYLSIYPSINLSITTTFGCETDVDMLVSVDGGGISHQVLWHQENRHPTMLQDGALSRAIA